MVNKHVCSQMSCFCQGNDNIQLDGMYVSKVVTDSSILVDHYNLSIMQASLKSNWLKMYSSVCCYSPFLICKCTLFCTALNLFTMCLYSTTFYVRTFLSKLSLKLCLFSSRNVFMCRDDLSQRVTRLTAESLPVLELNSCYEILLDISRTVLQAC